MASEHEQWTLSQEETQRLGIQHVSSGQTIFTITPDGSVVLGEGMTSDEASRAFWELLSESNPLKPQLAASERQQQKLQETLESSLAMQQEDEQTIATMRALLDQIARTAPCACWLDTYASRVAWERDGGHHLDDCYLLAAITFLLEHPAGEALEPMEDSDDDE